MRSNFDKSFDDSRKSFDRTFNIMLGFWAAGVCLTFLFVIGLAYVACHFLEKIW